MESHVKALGALNIALGTMGVIGALVILAVFGGAAGIVDATAVRNDPDAAIAIPILGTVGIGLFAILIVLSVPAIIVGIGLLRFRPWARSVGLVVSAINLINVPFGTILGIYGLWVLLSERSAPVFGTGLPAKSPSRLA
jgi:hypothetical protein